MSKETQFIRYKKLLQFIDEHYMEDLSIAKIEAVSNFAYRNINRIFQATNDETIGNHIRRVRLEKAAHNLTHSDSSIAQIAYSIGYKNVFAFRKAFKNEFKYYPRYIRENELVLNKTNEIDSAVPLSTEDLDFKFEIKKLQEFKILGLEHRGSYEDMQAIHKTWDQLEKYASKKRLISNSTIFISEILDDEAISEQLNSRITAGVIIDESIEFTPKGLFILKTIKSKRYAKFIHKGSYETCYLTYNKIYRNWMQQVDLEMIDAPTIEFYPNDESDTPQENLITEIFIPVS